MFGKPYFLFYFILVKTCSNLQFLSFQEIQYVLYWGLCQMSDCKAASMNDGHLRFTDTLNLQCSYSTFVKGTYETPDV